MYKNSGKVLRGIAITVLVLNIVLTAVSVIGVLNTPAIPVLSETTGEIEYISGKFLLVPICLSALLFLVASIEMYAIGDTHTMIKELTAKNKGVEIVLEKEKTLEDCINTYFKEKGIEKTSDFKNLILTKNNLQVELKDGSVHAIDKAVVKEFTSTLEAFKTAAKAINGLEDARIEDGVF